MDFEISKYIIEIVSKNSLGKIIKDINKEKNFDKLVKLMLSGIDKKSKKEILKIILAQRENEAYKNKTYEVNKHLFEEVRKEIRKL